MLIVSGWILVEPAQRVKYLEASTGIIAQARKAAGCLDFSLSPDPLQLGRVNVYERWEDDNSLHAFRDEGASSSNSVAILEAHVEKYRISATEPA